jgi:hypothetical protein
MTMREQKNNVYAETNQKNAGDLHDKVRKLKWSLKHLLHQTVYIVQVKWSSGASQKIELDIETVLSVCPRVLQ